MNKKEYCKLCKQFKILQNSHVIPKFIYRYMRKYQDNTKNINGLLLLDGKHKKLDITQRQWTEKLFCENCEQLLSKNESKFAKIFFDINKMDKKEISKLRYTNYEELFNEVQKTIPDITLDEYKKILDSNYFSLKKLEDIKYFAVSYFLRQTYLVKNNLDINYIKTLEGYILGKDKVNLNLIITLNNGEAFKAFSSTFMFDSLNDFKHYNFILPEMWFHIIFDIHNKLNKNKIFLQNQDFWKDEDIKKILSEQYQNIKVTDKAKKYNNL